MPLVSPQLHVKMTPATALRSAGATHCVRLDSAFKIARKGVGNPYAEGVGCAGEVLATSWSGLDPKSVTSDLGIVGKDTSVNAVRRSKI